MKKLAFAVCAMLLAALAGCSTTLVRGEPIPVRIGGAEVQMTRVVEALLSMKGVRVQALNGAWKDHALQAQCVMKGDGDKLTVVFLAPQIRLVTINLERPHALRCERAPQIPSAFEPENALLDLAFVNLPVDELRRLLAPALRVEENADGARLLLSRNGTLVAELSPAGVDGVRRFRNAVYGYEYEIRDISQN